MYITEIYAGDRGTCMGTSLESYRLEKLSKITLNFSESITIGISIQMHICSHDTNFPKMTQLPFTPEN